MSKQQFSSSKEAMDWLLRGESPAKEKSGKLETDIATALAGKSTPGKSAPGKSSPKARAPASTARRGPTAKTARRGSMSANEYFLSLPESIDMTAGRYVALPEVAKRIRSEIAGAVNAGALPDATTVGVTKDNNSIHVRVTGWRGAVFNSKYQEHLMDPSVKWDEPYGSTGGSRHGYRDDPRLTKELNDALALIQRIAQRHNYDRSDSQSDYFNVGYYLTVTADSVLRSAEGGIKTETNKEHAELLAKAEIAARAVGPAATKSIARKDLRSASDRELKSLVRIADEAKGRPVAYDASRRGWYPVSKEETTAERIKLDNTEYKVVSKSETSYHLMGPRGGYVILVRNGKQPDYWGVNKDRGTTWYRKNPDGTFTRTN